MSISPAVSSGISGLNTAVRGLQRAAHEIATVNVPRTGKDGVSRTPGLDSTTKALVDLRIYTSQGAASVKVIKATDELLGTLLDERA
jgi:flagellar hook-associated protein FlgK